MAQYRDFLIRLNRSITGRAGVDQRAWDELRFEQEFRPVCYRDCKIGLSYPVRDIGEND